MFTARRLESKSIHASPIDVDLIGNVEELNKSVSLTSDHPCPAPATTVLIIRWQNTRGGEKKKRWTVIPSSALFCICLSIHLSISLSCSLSHPPLSFSLFPLVFTSPNCQQKVMKGGCDRHPEMMEKEMRRRDCEIICVIHGEGRDEST